MLIPKEVFDEVVEARASGFFSSDALGGWPMRSAQTLMCVAR